MLFAPSSTQPQPKQHQQQGELVFTATLSFRRHSPDTTSSITGCCDHHQLHQQHHQQQHHVAFSTETPLSPLSPAASAGSPSLGSSRGGSTRLPVGFRPDRRRSSVFSLSEGATTTSRASSSSVDQQANRTIGGRNPTLGQFEQQLSQSLESLSMDELFGAGQSPEEQQVRDEQQQQLELQQEPQQEQQQVADDQFLRHIIDTLIDEDRRAQRAASQSQQSSSSDQPGTSSSSQRTARMEQQSGGQHGGSRLPMPIIKQEPDSGAGGMPFASLPAYRSLFPSAHSAMLLRNFDFPCPTASSAAQMLPSMDATGQFTMPAFGQQTAAVKSYQQQREQCPTVSSTGDQQQQAALAMARFASGQSAGTSFSGLMQGFGMFPDTQHFPGFGNAPSLQLSSPGATSSQSMRNPFPAAAAMLSAASFSQSAPTGPIQSAGGSPSTSSGQSHAVQQDEGQPAEEQKLCAVCNDYAVCQHYGALTCEGCKGFFKRTVQKKSQYVCAGNKNCPIDKRYRSRCQYCRFQKCLDVGMVREIVRYGSLQGRRGRLPSKVKSSTTAAAAGGAPIGQMAGGGQPEPAPSPPLPILTIIAKAFTEMHAQLGQQQRQTKHLSLSDFCTLLELELQSIYGFARRVPDIGDLSEQELRMLVLHNFFPIFAVRQAFRWAELKNNHIQADFCFEGGICAQLEDLPVEWRPWFGAVAAAAPTFRLLVEWDVACLASLIVLQMFKVGPTLSGMVTQAALDRFNSTYINALKDHCCQQGTAQPSKLSRIVSQVAQFEPFRQLGADCLGASLRQLPAHSQPSQNLAHLFLHSGGAGGALKLETSAGAAYFGVQEQVEQQQAGSSQQFRGMGGGAF